MLIPMHYEADRSFVTVLGIDQDTNEADNVAKRTRGWLMES